MGATQEVWRQLKQDLMDPVVILSVIILIVLLSMTGPFGSYLTMNFVGRIYFWAPTILIGSVGGLIIGILVANRAGKIGDGRLALVSAFLSAILMAGPLYWLILLFLAPPSLTLWGLVESAMLVFFANLGICSLRKAWIIPTAKTPVMPDGAASGLPLFLARLPPEVQGPVTLISGRNHHIDIETEAGAAPLLMRFSDAVLQLDPQNGMQVHRSHWVAFRIMRSIEKNGQRHFLILDKGVRVPISKPRVEDLRCRLGLPLEDRTADPISQAAE